MCGIAGIAGTWPDREARVERMAEAIAHRGPDDAGLWHDADCSLGHRRLALLDLSPAGRQPMSNEDGRVHVVFNGEIYNFAELRADLEGRGHRFRSRTDSEVLVHLYEEAGDEMVSRLRGMFAFALWDARERRLLLARDHFGQKPLFYAEQNGALLFASEIKALLAAGIPRDIDPRGVDLFLSLQFVPSPFTCYRAIRRLPPATILIRDAGGRTRLRQYWSLRARPASRGRLDAMVEETGARLRAAVAEQLVADVPVGLYLSGGIDSTLVLGRAASAAQGLRAFAVGYREAPYSELPHARRVARHHRVALEEVVLSPQAADPGELARLFDEPFSDPAALPVVHLARAARRHVTAVLTGDGGDELFGGYQHHVLAFWLMKLGQLSRARAAIARVALDRLPESVRRSPRWPRLRRILETLSHVEPAAALLHLRRQLDPELRARLYTPDFFATVADAEPSEILCAREAAPRTIEEALLWTDRLVLADRLLAKTDITAMSVGLECRAPFLDLRIAELAASLPAAAKVHGLRGKWILRKLLSREIGQDVWARPKMGLTLPVESWLRDELADLVRDTLLAPDARTRAYLRPDLLARLYEEHCRGEGNWRRILWSALVLEAWLRNI